MNAQEWLDLWDKDKNEFAIEAARLLTPKPWPHDWANNGRGQVSCRKCSFEAEGLPVECCSVPDPLVIDWNTAIPLYRGASGALPFDLWERNCGPEHLIIAACWRWR